MSPHPNNSSKTKIHKLLLISLYMLAGSTCTYAQHVDKAQAVCNQLANGVNISYLEDVQKGRVRSSNRQLRRRLQHAAELGFKAVRLPVALDAFCHHASATLHPTLFRRIRTAVTICRSHGMKLIVSYHRGKLTNDNYLAEKTRIASLWAQLARQLTDVPDTLLVFEPYNEPVLDEWRWKEVFTTVADSIRRWNSSRLLVFGATNYNSIYELSRMGPLPMHGIIYTFHFYEPYLFTHQGAPWAGNQCATTGIPFPYSKDRMPPLNPQAKGTWGEHNYYQYATDGNDTAVFHKLRLVYEWQQHNQLPLFCGEFGSHVRFIDDESRCHYTSTVVQALRHYGIPGMYWELNRSFGLEKDGRMPACFRKLFNLNTHERRTP